MNYTPGGIIIEPIVQETNQDTGWEEKIRVLRDSISSKLREKGGSAERHMIDGVDYVRVASRNESGESSRDYFALIIAADGEWSGDYDTAGFPITNPSIDDLLRVFARINQMEQSGGETRQKLLGELVISLETTLQKLSTQ